ncbi:MAG: MFS transporter [Nanoarchaeota archaeon]
MYHDHRLLHFALKRELSEIYISFFLRAFAISLIGVFVPIYLVNEIGVKFTELLVFYIIFFITLAIGYPFSAKLSSKIGVKHVIMLSIPFHIIFYFLLYNMLRFDLSVYLLGFIIGFGSGLFWYAYNADFAKVSDKKHRGEEVKILFVAASIIGIVGPFIGGYLLSLLDFYLLFMMVIILLISSVVPLLSSKDITLGHDFNLMDIFIKKNFDNFFLYFVQGVRVIVAGVFWPLFIFYTLKGYFSLGIIISGTALVSSIAVWFTGNYIDKIRKVNFAKVGSVVDGIVTFFRAFARNFLEITGLSLISGIAHNLVEISTEALGFDQANRTDISGFMIFREFVYVLGRVSFLLAILLIGLDPIASIKLGFFIMAGLGILQKFV